MTSLNAKFRMLMTNNGVVFRPFHDFLIVIGSSCCRKSYMFTLFSSSFSPFMDRATNAPTDRDHVVISKYFLRPMLPLKNLNEVHHSPNLVWAVETPRNITRKHEIFIFAEQLQRCDITRHCHFVLSAR